MKKFTYVGTWRMSYAGMVTAAKSKSTDITSFIMRAISHIEDYPLFKSVGRGGLPNEIGVVEMDAGYMNGATMTMGALMAVQEIANPFQAAVKLSQNKYNRMLAGQGAQRWAIANNVKTRQMETSTALQKWQRQVQKLKANPQLTPYDGHDTVCFVGTDGNKDVIAGTSTSGLFMKKPGRIGDSPLVGSGFYADSHYGAAAATGLGEDIARGVLSFQVVNHIKDGHTPVQAAQKALSDFETTMQARKQSIGSISIIAINTVGQWGIATNCLFQFSVFTDEMSAPELYIAQPSDLKGQMSIVKAPPGYYEEYIESLKAKSDKI